MHNRREKIYNHFFRLPELKIYLLQLRRSLQQDIDSMNKVLGALDSRRDKKYFLEKNDAAFMIPKKFEYQPVRRDETEMVQKPVIEELESR